MANVPPSSEFRNPGDSAIYFSSNKIISSKDVNKIINEWLFGERLRTLYVFVRFFGLDRAQNTIVVYSVLRN